VNTDNKINAMFSKSEVVQFLRIEGSEDLKRLVWLACFVGVANTALIALINMSAAKAAEGESVLLQFFLYSIVLVFFLIVTRKANRDNIRSAQFLIHKFKIRILGEYFRSDLQTVDQVGKAKILQSLGRDTQVVSGAIPILVMMCQSAATLTCLTIYMATISWIAFCITFAAAVIIFFVSAKFILGVKDSVSDAFAKDGEVFDLFGDFLNGFKEIKMHSKRARDITTDMVEQSLLSSNLKAYSLVGITNFFNYLQTLMFVVVGILIFIVPMLVDSFADSVVAASTAGIFLVGQLSGLIQTIPALSEANASASSLLSLQEELSKTAKQSIENTQVIQIDKFESLCVQGITYEHKKGKHSSGFALGPISYQFKAGNLYFIKGSNGSGKTTFMRILTGLYKPSHGSISVNGIEVEQPASSSYRDLFSVVFSDFYLFQKLYGLFDLAEDDILSWQKVLEIEKKFSITEGVFSHTQLSTGQRKRIALLVAMLESRDIIILDEWAADQDPQFRKQFYKQLLPKLKQMGKTVIAITHDDNYFNTADYVLSFRDGKLFEDAVE
jgi:putative ATP-binding cassette transporter